MESIWPWSEENALRAKHEGWVVYGGYVRPQYDERGSGKFNSATHLIAFLRRKAATSDWHRQVYLQLPWTHADSHLAQIDGWDFSGLEIVTRNRRIFDTHELAAAGVARAAQAGEPLAMKATITLAKNRLIRSE